MKRLILLIAIVAVVGLPSANVALADGDGETVYTEWNVRYPISGVMWGCTEEVSYSGIAHEVIKIWRDVDGKWHAKWHVNMKGTAVGQESGDEFVINETINETSHRITVPYVLTQVYDAKLMSKGDAPNRRVKAQHHFTVNANGEVTTYFLRFRDDCK